MPSKPAKNQKFPPAFGKIKPRTGMSIFERPAPKAKGFDLVGTIKAQRRASEIQALRTAIKVARRRRDAFARKFRTGFNISWSIADSRVFAIEKLLADELALDKARAAKKAAKK